MVRSSMVVLFLEMLIILVLSLKGHCLKISRSTNKSGGDFDFEIDPQKEFELTHILTDKTEYSQYLLKNNIIRYFYILRKEHIPLTLEVTPCISRLDWNVTLIRRLPEETPLVTDYDELNDQFRSGSTRALGVRLHRYTGDDRNSFHSDSAESGIYKIDVKPLDSDTYIRLYASVSSDPNKEATKDPTIGKVTAKQRGKRRLKISWKGLQVQNKQVKYCVAVNRQRNFKTQCGFRSYAFGDHPNLRPSLFFYRDNYRRAMKSLSPVKAASATEFNYKCMVNKTRHGYKGVRSGQTYYIDVFVVDRLSKRMISHVGTMVKAKSADTEASVEKTLKLSDGKAKSITLKRSSKAQLFVYDLVKPAKQLMFSVKPCGGSVTMKLYTEKSLIKKAKVKSLEYFTIDDAQTNKYFVQVSMKGKKTRQFNILATTRPSKYTYPKLPETAQINVYQSLIKCDSVTIGWMVTERRQKYCVYKREAVDSYKKLSTGEQCEGLKYRKKNEKVLCAYFRHRNKKRPVKTEKISNLKPGTDYIFDVYVSKRRLSLSYESVRVRTLDTC